MKEGMVKIEKGVMVMKNGKAWGIEYDDGKATVYGWIDPVNALIRNPSFCLKPTDVTYKGSHYERELSTAKLVAVTRTTTLTLHDEVPQ